MANGGSDSEAEIATGVANAVFNTAETYFDKRQSPSGNRQADARRLERRFSEWIPSDRTADALRIDWLMDYDPGTELFLSTLLRRFKEILSSR